MSLASPRSITVTVRQGRGYRIVRRARLSRNRETPLQKFWQQFWYGGTPEQVHARQLRLAARPLEPHLHRLHLP